MLLTKNKVFIPQIQNIIMAGLFFKGKKVGAVDSSLARFLKEIKILKKRDKLFLVDNK